MIVYALESDLVEQGDSIPELLFQALRRRRLRLRTHDIIAISSKIIGISEGRIRQLSDVKPTGEARRLGRKYSMSPQFAQTILDESDQVLGGVKGTLLTIRSGDATANGGVDRKNAPSGSVVLWPRDPDASARKILDEIRKRSGKQVGVVVVDSRVTPIRLGTIGFAIGLAGFDPIEDVRGKTDLFGRRIEITRRAIADGVASAAQVVMGEGAEMKPFALIRGAPAHFARGSSIRRARLVSKDCLYMSQIHRTSKS